MASLLNKLMLWQFLQCNGDREHVYGVKIRTLDNPGWSVKIDILETNLSNKHFDPFEFKRNNNNWIQCKVHDGQYIGTGGPFNLEEILSVFLDFAENNEQND